MLGDWLRVGNQVWLGKYWDSRAGGGRESSGWEGRCEPGESHIPTHLALAPHSALPQTLALEVDEQHSVVTVTT